MSTPTPTHQVLFRKYRPQRFDEVIFQDLPVGALQNSFKIKKIGHAYIFFGPRGVGKTSIARILAKRLNCEKPTDNEPCNSCSSCTEITKGISSDVMEIDAASNNGVDHIRELRENVKFAPMSGKYRIYIIDEVHMLSTAAFNALLKTLEEPPSHVVFILATTEYHKIPDTIMSRCQDFVFKKVPIQVLTDYVETLSKRENLEYDREGLFWIAKKGDGSVRDTLSFMEQAVVFTDSKLTGKNIREMIGYQGIGVYSQFLKSLLGNTDRSTIFTQIETYFQEGRDLSKFLWDLLEFMNALLLIHENLAEKENVNLPLEDIQKIKEEFRNVDTESLNLVAERIFTIYESLNSMRLRTSFEIKIFLEIQFRKLILDLEKPTVSGLLSKINDLAKMVQMDIDNLPAVSPAPSQPKASSPQPQPSSSSAPNPEPSSSPKSELPIEEVANQLKEAFSGTDIDIDKAPKLL